MKKDNLSDQFQVNDEIRAKEVRIIGEGIEPKVVSLREALQIADSMELDLVLISPNAVPPVCRIRTLLIRPPRMFPSVSAASMRRRPRSEDRRRSAAGLKAAGLLCWR